MYESGHGTLVCDALHSYWFLLFYFSFKVLDNTASCKPKPVELVFQQQMFAIYLSARELLFSQSFRPSCYYSNECYIVNES